MKTISQNFEMKVVNFRACVNVFKRENNFSMSVLLKQYSVSRIDYAEKMILSSIMEE